MFGLQPSFWLTANFLASRCDSVLVHGRVLGGDFLRQKPGRPKLSNVLLLDGGDHPLALASGSGHG